MKRNLQILIFLLTAIGLFAEGPVVELLQPQNLGWTEFGLVEYADDSGSVIIRKWDSCNCTSDIFQTIQMRIHDADGIDWSSLALAVVTYGGTINHNGTHFTWYGALTSLPFHSDSGAVDEFDSLCEQDYNVIVDSLSDSTGIVSITPLGRGGRPDFFCHDSCNYSPYYYGPCCLNTGD